MEKAFLSNGDLYVVSKSGHIRQIIKEDGLGVYLQYYLKLWYAHMNSILGNGNKSEIPDGVQYDISDKKWTLV